MGMLGISTEPRTTPPISSDRLAELVFEDAPPERRPNDSPGTPANPRQNDRVSTALLVASLASVAVLMWWFSLRVWGNADAHWSWLLVEQFWNGAPKSLAVVDGNRLFPDFAFASVLWWVLHAFGVELLSRHYLTVYSLVVLGTAALGISRSIRDRRVAAFAVCLFAAVLAPNLAYIESIRPGFHAMSAAASMLFIARRVRRVDAPYGVVELVTLTMLVVSGRFLLTLLVIPLGTADLLTRRVRRNRSWRLLLPAVFGVFGWLALGDLPNVHVSYAPSQFRLSNMPLWFMDYGRSLIWVRRPLGGLTLPTHAMLLALLVGIALVRFARRSQSTPLSSGQRYLVVLAFTVTEIGGATLRAGDYLLGWRAYIFVLPLILGSAAIAVLLRSMLHPNVFLAAACALLATTVGATAWNAIALEREPLNGAFDPGYALLKEHGLLNSVGLSSYWVSYEVRGNHDPHEPVYNVDGGLFPYFWSINPWDHLYDRKTGTVDLHRKIHYVLSVNACDQGDCDSEQFTPRREAIVRMLGEPDEWLFSDGPGFRYRLAIYRQGADPAKFVAASFRLMRIAGIDTRGYDRPSVEAERSRPST